MQPPEQYWQNQVAIIKFIISMKEIAGQRTPLNQVRRHQNFVTRNGLKSLRWGLTRIDVTSSEI